MWYREYEILSISAYKQTKDPCTDSKRLAAFLRIDPIRKVYYDLKQKGVRLQTEGKSDKLLSIETQPKLLVLLS